jgi:hypothetical protein
MRREQLGQAITSPARSASGTTVGARYRDARSPPRPMANGGPVTPAV